MLDRNLAPPAQPLAPVRLPAYQLRHLPNGLPVYLLPYGSNEVVELQIVFQAGTSMQPATGVASYTARMMLEGTSQHSSLEQARLLDGHGAWLSYELEEEALAFKIDTITAKLAEVLPLLVNVVQSPTFPVEEWEQMQRRDLEKLTVSEQKTSYLARRNFGHLLFGPTHPYGAGTGREELGALRREQLMAFQQDQLHLGNAYLAVVGRFHEEEVLAQLTQYLGQLPRPAANPLPSRASQVTALNGKGRHHIERPGGGMQATVRLGHRAMARNHPDFYVMSVINTILGGYFGSRLMKNIREEKGYTYGIYSAWSALKYDGLWIIQADTALAHVEPLITEVKAEVERLATQGVSPQELDLVKNYLVGRNLSQRETAFQLGDVLRYSLFHGLSFEELDRRFDVIKALQPEEIAPLVRRYFHVDELLEVVAG